MTATTSGVRVLVGTRKGAFILTSDGKRQKWDVSGPHLTGWEIYHVKGSPADPNRLYASQSSGWHGQVMQRSNDGGKTWEPVGNKFIYDGVPGTHQWYDGTPHPWEFKRVWHLEPSLADPDTVYAGVEDAALFKTTDGGQNWQELSGLRGHGSGPRWQPGAGGLCLHTILLDPTDPQRIYIAISAAGSGMYCERSPRLIGFQVLPPSSVRKQPAAEMAMKMRSGFLGSMRIVWRPRPPAPGCHLEPVPWVRRPESSCQLLPPSVVRNIAASSTPA